MTTYVYVIAKDTDGALSAPVKVGISDSPVARLKTFQTSCPFKIGLALQFAVPSRETAFKVERMFHQKNADHRLTGEWFNTRVVVAIEGAISCYVEVCRNSLGMAEGEAWLFVDSTPYEIAADIDRQINLGEARGLAALQ